MSFKEFFADEVFYNTVKTHPKYEFHIHGGDAYFNKNPLLTGDFSNKIDHVKSSGYVSLYEININRPSDSLVAPFITKDSARTAFATVSQNSFNTDFQFGDKISGKYPHSASVSRIYAPEGQDYLATTFDRPAVSDTDNKKYIRALKNPLKEYSGYSPHYEYSSSLGDKGFQKMNIIGVPSIFYGSSIRKGSVRLRTYITGTLVAEATDSTKTGEIIETTGSNVGEVAGVVMYHHGLLLLTGSWNMNTSIQEPYINTEGSSKPKWITFGTGIDVARNAVDKPHGVITKTSYEMVFEGTNDIPTITMLAHAEKAEFNASSNPTFLDSGSYVPASFDSGSYAKGGGKIKNIVKSEYVNHSASFEKITYISKVGIYDEDKKLLGYAVLANPIRKKENRDYTFKLKMDF